MVAVIVYIAERDRLPLLQVADPGGGGHVLKIFPPVITKHPVRQQRAVVKPAGSEVKVGVAVIIQVSIIAAHAEERMVQPDFAGHIPEAAVVIITVEAGRFGGERPSQIVGGRLPGLMGEILYRISGDEDVEPAVVVVVPEPAGVALNRLADAGLLGHVRKLPLAGGIFPVITHEQVRLTQTRYVEVRQAIIIVVPPGGPLHPAEYAETHFVRHVGERPVAVVMKKLARAEVLIVEEVDGLINAWGRGQLDVDA